MARPAPKKTTGRKLNSVCVAGADAILSLSHRRAIPAIPTRCRAERLRRFDPPSAPEPPGERFAEEPPCGFLDLRAPQPEAPVDGPAHARSKQFQAAQFAGATRPQEFVRFGAAQHVVLRRALLERVPDRQTHGDQADALLRKSRVESRLVKIERAVVPVAMKDRSRLAVQPEDKEPEPAPPERELACLIIERQEPGASKGLRAAPLVPAAGGEWHERRQGLPPVRFWPQPIAPDRAAHLKKCSPPLAGRAVCLARGL